MRALKAYHRKEEWENSADKDGEGKKKQLEWWEEGKVREMKGERDTPGAD